MTRATWCEKTVELLLTAPGASVRAASLLVGICTILSGCAPGLIIGDASPRDGQEASDVRGDVSVPSDGPIAHDVTMPRDGSERPRRHGLHDGSIPTDAHADTSAPRDAAAHPDAGPICPGSGGWCGSAGVMGGAPDTLYNCPGAGLPPTTSTPCPHGCQVEPAGTNDQCSVAGPVCPGSGAWCGSAAGFTGADPNTLYQCPGAGAPPRRPRPVRAGARSKRQACPITAARRASRARERVSIAAHTASRVAARTPYTVVPLQGAPPVLPRRARQAARWSPRARPTAAPTQVPATRGPGRAHMEAGQLSTGHSYAGWCLLFVATAFNSVGHSQSWLAGASAAVSLTDAQATGRFVNWSGSCPCGAVIYWAANSCNGGDGHIAICNGDGR